MSVVKLDTRDIDRIAAEWFARVRLDDLSASDKRDFDEWLSADERHRAAYEALGLDWADMRKSSKLAEMASEISADTRPSRPRVFADWFGRIVRPRAAFAAFGGTALAAMLAWFLFVPAGEPGGVVGEVLETRVAEIRNATLDDGSLVTIGAKSALEVVFDDTQRRVVLNEGEAFFSVEKDPERPFLVFAGETVVRVVGTQFDVHRGPDGVEVTVLEGVVEVLEGAVNSKELPEDVDKKHVLTAGQKALSSPTGEVSDVEAVSAYETAAWRSGRLVYDNASLREVIADANRYYDGRIELASSAIGDLRVSASFRTDEIDTLVNTLTRGLPVDARRPSPGLIVLHERRESR